jgi:hypothetical protein
VIAPLRDVWLVARFEVLRALRTWTALALAALYMVSTTGASLVFVGLIWALEQTLASTLGAARPSRPGMLLDQLLEEDSLTEVLGAMVGNATAVEELLAIPLLAVFHLWFGMMLVPFFAATAGSESLSTDLRTRSIRFEVQRTGRLELVFGRFFGQLGMTTVATMLTVLGAWAVGMFAMVGNEALPLFGWLAWLDLRVVAFAAPFVGLGIAVSQLTASPALARVLAIIGTVASWALFFFAGWLQDDRLPVLGDLITQVLPQGWRAPLWDADPVTWLPAAGVLLSMGLIIALVGYLPLSRRDL